MSNSAAPKITIEHRYLDVVLYEYQPTKKEQASGLAMRAALETACLSGANLNGAYLSGANLDGAHLSGAKLSGADMSGANMSGANLSGANLDDTYLPGANLSGAKLSGAYMSGANLSGAYLSGANLFGAYLYGAYMSGAHLSGANFSRANLDGTYLRGAYLDGACLSGAYLGGAKNLIGDRPVFTLGPIGSRCEYFTAYLTDKGVYLHAGCFFGTVAEFVARLEREHGTNKHWQEYSAALALIECHARLWTPAGLPGSAG